MKTTITKLNGNYGVTAENILVPYTIPGEEVAVENLPKVGNKNYGKLVEITQPSIERSTPICKHFGTCGGCTMQHFYPGYVVSQAAYVDKTLKENDIKCEVITTCSVDPNTRRRASFKYENGKLGFYELASHKLVHLQECHILLPEIFALIPYLEKLIPTLKLKLDEVFVQSADNGLDVTFVVKEMPKTMLNMVLQEELAAQTQIIRFNIKCGKNVDITAITRTPYITSGKYKIQISPTSFLQPTTDTNKIIESYILPHIKPGAKLIDLYAGLGIYSLAAIDKVDNVTAVEFDEAMCNSLKAAGRNYHLQNLQVRQANLVENPIKAAELNKFDQAILNPPRMGAYSQCKEIAASELKELIYVSCSIDNFIRDMGALARSGFKIRSLTALDQFLWSSHLELITVIGRD